MVNTEKVLQAVKSRATERGLYKMIIASETGKSALKVLEVFKGTRIEVKEIIAKHIRRVKVPPEYKDENWRSNLDAYYL